MTREEHYRVAELLAEAASYMIETPGTPIADVTAQVALAQVHAALASAPMEVAALATDCGSDS